MFGSISEVIDNTFLGNEAQFDGGAIYIFMGSPGTATIVNNQFIENVAYDHGGAIEAGQSWVGSRPLWIEGNLFVRNEAHGMDLPTDSGTGGGISMRGWPGTIINNTFVGNVGAGESDCTGGHILIDTDPEYRVVIERNIS